MKKIQVLIVSAILLSFIGNINIFAEEGENSDSEYKNILLEDYDSELLSNLEFFPDDISLYDELNENDIVMLIDDFIIYKKNLNQEYKIDKSTLNETNINKNLNSRAIVEKYIPRPTGKKTAGTYWSVSTRGFGQNMSTLYLTRAQGNEFYSQNYKPSPYLVAIELIISTYIGYKLKLTPFQGLLFDSGVALANIVNDGFWSTLSSNLSGVGYGVEIRQGKSNIGVFRSSMKWDGKSVRSRNGTVSNSNMTTVEKTEIYWDFSK